MINMKKCLDKKYWTSKKIIALSLFLFSGMLYLIEEALGQKKEPEPITVAPIDDDSLENGEAQDGV